VGARTSRTTLADIDLVFARSRRRAAARRAEPVRRSGLDWRPVAAVVLAVAILGFIAEGSRLDLAPAKSTAAAAPKAASSLGAPCGIPAVFIGAFRLAAHETGLPLSLLAAVAWEESRMDPQALSGAGARGLLQIMPGTAKALAAAGDDPRTNIRAGARYLRQLLDRFHGNVELALAAYNAGPSAVERAGAAPTMQTLRYAKNIEARAATLAAC
jgi:soluble lytic murein transglycosylase-like protein